jgi:cob(I)alamin adenosyltransferase
MGSMFTTKNGDAGTTRLISGEIVSKAHPAVVCTGTLDTVRARLAEGRLLLLASDAPDKEYHAEFLFWLLHVCFLVGTQVNDPRSLKPEYRVDTVGEAHLKRLEAEQARIEATLNMPRSFIVTATTLEAARFDVIATEVRGLERDLVTLAEFEPAFEAVALLAFVNRLSDYLVVLARALDRGVHQPVDYARVSV